jgi:hypothetical protein
MPIRRAGIVTASGKAATTVETGVRFANEIRHLQNREPAAESHTSHRIKITQSINAPTFSAFCWVRETIEQSYLTESSEFSFSLFARLLQAVSVAARPSPTPVHCRPASPLAVK